MIPGFPLAARPLRQSRPSPWWRLPVVLGLCAGPVAAQTVEPPPRDVHIAASEHCLWLVVVSDSQSRLFSRETEGGFDRGRSTNRRIVTQAVLDRDLLVFFDDGAVYRYPPGTGPPTAEAVLPLRQTPLDLVGGNERVYAIVTSTAAAELPREPTEETDTVPGPFNPGDSSCSLAVFDGRRWSAVATLPAEMRPAGDARPQSHLCRVQDTLLLLTPAEQPGQIHWFYLDRQEQKWIPRNPITAPAAADFRVVSLSRVPTLVTMPPGAAQGEQPAVLRLLGNPAQADGAWQEPTGLELSDLPADVTLTSYTDVVGFNQHLGLLGWAADGQAYLRFARIDGTPAEPTFPVAQALAGRGALVSTHELIGQITLVLVAVVLVGLFVFRRGSMVRVIELPPGCALALHVQRTAAWLIDFTPFTIAAASAVGIPWSEGLESLGRWGISPDPQGVLPDEKVLLWWGLSVAGFTTYSLVMELITGRTVGKVIARVRLLSEAGTPPTAGQILARNLTRLIELMPQFWLFVVLVIASRNRQRLGDIFARTVAVRLLPRRPKRD